MSSFTVVFYMFSVNNERTLAYMYIGCFDVTVHAGALHDEPDFYLASSGTTLCAWRPVTSGIEWVRYTAA